MPLSHEEQRVLNEIERLLRSEDPRFVDRIGRKHRRVGGLIGIAMLAFCCGLVMVTIGMLGESGWHVAIAAVGLVIAAVSCFATVVIQERRWSGRRHHRRPNRPIWP